MFEDGKRHNSRKLQPVEQQLSSLRNITCRKLSATYKEKVSVDTEASMRIQIRRF